MKKASLKTLVGVIRAPFFTAVIIPALLGAIIAWQEGAFHLGYLVLTLLGIVCTNAGLNMSNDYFDHVSGNDENNQELTPFSGGSRTIQEGVLAPRQVLLGSAFFFLIAIAIGVYLALARGWGILWLGLIGIFLAVFHNAPPIKLYYLAPGVGELAAGIGCGPLVVLGSYYVQAQRFSYEALWASIPLGLIISAVLYINEFPDYEADRKVGKTTLVVALGRERAVWGYVALLAGTYAVVVAGVALNVFSYAILLALLSLPLAYQGIRGAMRFHSDTQRLIPTNALTIKIHLATGLLLCLGYALPKIIS